jgi:amidohydrolase
MTSNSLKEKVNQCIDERREKIISLGQQIYANPEIGYKEHKTSELITKQFSNLGLNFTHFGDIPGVKATLDTGKPGPGLAIFGELDAVICPEHADSNKETGAVHACGHNVQLANMIGAAVGILASEAATHLSGKIHFIAVPAEEYIDIPYRKELREKGVIRYLSGKPEILARGFLDDVDVSMMLHVAPTKKKFLLDSSWNGCIVKNINYIGKASHAGDSPHEGINALYSANIALTAINSLRETFKEEDYIRVHPIITKGGSVVNAVPSDVRIETYVRGKTMEAILETNKKVNRALIGGAIAMGTKVEIEDIPGFFPLTFDVGMVSIAEDVMTELVGKDGIDRQKPHSTGCSDMGDLCAVMPVIHPSIGGIVGGLHSSEYRIIDFETTYILGAKFLADMAIELMMGKAEKAIDIVNNYQPTFKSKDEYIEFNDKLFSKKTYSEGNLR